MSDVAAPVRQLRRAVAMLGGLLGGLIVVALPVAGVASTSEASMFEDCGAIADRMERAEDMPPGLLQAVALAESARPGQEGSWPWTVRSGDEGFYLPSKQAALDKVRELRAAGRSNIDVGCMQINLGYHATAFASLEDAFDPVSNVAYGAGFLKRLRQETRSWATATGRYHSADRERSEAYRARVYRLWRDLRRRQGREAPVIAEALFLGDGLARIAGGAAAAGPDRAPSPRILTPSARDRPEKFAVLRGR